MQNKKNNLIQEIYKKVAIISKNYENITLNSNKSIINIYIKTDYNQIINYPIGIHNFIYIGKIYSNSKKQYFIKEENKTKDSNNIEKLISQIFKQKHYYPKAKNEKYLFESYGLLINNENLPKRIIYEIINYILTIKPEFNIYINNYNNELNGEFTHSEIIHSEYFFNEQIV